MLIEFVEHHKMCDASIAVRNSRCKVSAEVVRIVSLFSDLVLRMQIYVYDTLLSFIGLIYYYLVCLVSMQVETTFAGR